MLKYIKQHMAGITGIEIYPMLSFILFFAFFIGILIWVIKADKNHFKKMSDLPLSQD